MSIINDLVGTNKEEHHNIEFTDDDKNLMLEYLKRDGTPERKNLLKEFQTGSMLTGPYGLRKKLGEIDLEYFGKAYFPNYFYRETPQLHRDLDELWMEAVTENSEKGRAKKGKKRAVAAPRGHAKSTNLTFKDTVHSIAYEYKHYILILSDSSEQAEGFLTDIRDAFEENPKIIEDFGELKGKVWKSNVILTSTNTKIEAIGCGKKVRGRRHKNWRPDLIVLDDIENDENVRTPEQRKKLRNWFYKAVSKAGDTYTDIIYIGTILHYDSLLVKVLRNPGYRGKKYKAVIRWSENPGLWDKWKEIYTNLDDDKRDETARKFFEDHKEEMLEGTEVLWEDKLNYYDLMVIRADEGTSSFNSELQNEPIDPNDCLFSEEDFEYYNPFEIDFSNKKFIFYGFVDPSLGKNNKSDYSAIITVAKDKNSGYLYVVDADLKQRKPSKIISDVLGKADWIKREFKKKYKRFGCETNQFQDFLKEKLAEESAKEGIYLPIKGINQTGNKVLRIQRLEPDIQNKYIKFNKKHKLLLEQLKFFPQAANDDGPDALEGATSLAKTKNSIADGWR